MVDCDRHDDMKWIMIKTGTKAGLRWIQNTSFVLLQAIHKPVVYRNIGVNGRGGQ